jgi:hypothetical protein
MIDITRPELTFTEILEITLTNGVKAYLTCYPTPLVYDGHTYLPIPPGDISGWRTPINYGTDLQVDKVTFKVGIISITVGDTKVYTAVQIVRRGFLRGAWGKLTLIDWNSLSTEGVNLFEGRINDDISYNAGILTFSISSLLDLLDRSVPQIVYSEFCQHHSTTSDYNTYLFGRYCGLLKTAWKYTGVCIGVTNQTLIVADVFSDSIQSPSFWVKGEIKMTSGNNAGVSRTIREAVDGSISVVGKFPESNAVLDTFDVYPGCDKLRVTCYSRFHNTDNCYDAPNIPKQQDLVFT